MYFQMCHCHLKFFHLGVQKATKEANLENYNIGSGSFMQKRNLKAKVHVGIEVWGSRINHQGDL